MSGIAGIAKPVDRDEVERMLDRIAYRGSGEPKVFEVAGATLGVIHAKAQPAGPVVKSDAVEDYVSEGHFAEARAVNGRLELRRDPLGVSPLYFGYTEGGTLCFASEVKALMQATQHVVELPPGCSFVGDRCQTKAGLQTQPPITDPPDVIARELRRRLEGAVRKRIPGPVYGAWLSGGLDSSAMAALARPHVTTLHTFAVGLAGAPDLEYAREVAERLDAEHHEVVVKDVGAILRAMPDVIYHLESFDALLVRSSLLNYMVGKLAAEQVPEVLSGEGGDELFAGYEYLKSVKQEGLAAELLEITNGLHNNALQRVDRCASAHGLMAHVAFLEPDVVEYALRIPVGLKIRDGVEKWILRQVVEGMLPERVVHRPKAKFWEGAGVGELLARVADERITDEDFRRERELPNGWTLNTKEELMYYREFKNHFGSLSDLTWMGRTKGAPVAVRLPA